jgi:hypothetical protein
MVRSTLLEALEHDRQGDWETAHTLAQQVETPDGYWLHAYLHRKEGDLGNAGYWYQRAGQPVPEDSLESEWKRLHEAFSG